MIVKLLTEHHLEFLSLKEAAETRLSLHLSNATFLEISCRSSIITYRNIVFDTIRDCALKGNNSFTPGANSFL